MALTQAQSRLPSLSIFSATAKSLIGSYFEPAEPSPSPMAKALEEAEKQMLRAVKTPLEWRMVPIPRNFINDNSQKVDQGYYYISTVSTKEDDSSHTKPDVVLVHGWGGGKGIWVNNIDDLAENFNVHAIDLLGWGRSSRPSFNGGPDQPQYAQKFWVESLEAWRQAVGLNKFTLVGHSMGGFVAASYALKYKENLNKLVLLSAIGLQGFRTEPPRAKSFLTRALISTIWSLTPQRVLRAFPETKLIQMISTNRPDLLGAFPYDDDTIARYVYSLMAAARPVSGELAFASLGSPTDGWRLPLKEKLTELKGMDIEFVYGERDWIDPTYAFTEIVPNFLPEARVHLLPGAGHHGYVQGWLDLDNIIKGLPSSKKTIVTSMDQIEERKISIA